MKLRYLASFFFLCLACYGQDYLPGSSLPTAHYVNFGAGDGLPLHRVPIAIEDHKGGMWLQVRENELEGSTFRLYLLDGASGKYVDLGIKKVSSKSKLFIRGITKSGILYGYIIQNDQSQLFLVNTVTEEVVHFDFGLDSEQKGLIQNVASSGNTIVVYSAGQSSVWLHEVIKGQLKLIWKTNIEFHKGVNTKKGYLPLYMNEEDIWFMASASTLSRINRKQTQHSDYTLNFPEAMDPNSGGIYPDGKGRLLLQSQRHSRTIYQLSDFHNQSEPQIQKLEPFQSYPDSISVSIFKDTLDQLLFVQHYRSGTGGARSKKTYSAFLRIDSGFLDYSEVLRPIHGISALTGMDFRKQILAAHLRGITNCRIMDNSSISSLLPGSNIKAIFPVSDNEFLIKEFGSGGTKTIQFTPEAEAIVTHEFSPLKGKQFFAQVDSNTVFIYGPRGTGLYSHSEGKFTLFNLDSRIRCISSAYNDSSIFMDYEGGLFFLNNSSMVATPVGDSLQVAEKPGNISEIHWSGESTAWLIASGNLYKLELYADGNAKLEKKMENHQLITLKEGGDQKLWLGSFNGIYLYDIEKGEFQVLNQKEGLPHNTVFSVLVDNFGFAWAGGYMGLAVVSPEGKLIATVDTSNGLASNELHRLAAFKARNGDLFFASPNGLSIIRPQMWWNSFVEKDELPINVDYLSYRVPDSQEKMILYDLSNSAITLPHNAREIQLKFSLSSSVNNRFSNIFYKLDNIDQDWVSAGVDRTIRIGYLESGTHKLNVQSRSSLADIPVSALALSIVIEPSFYQTSKFIIPALLISIVLLIGTGLLIRLGYRKRLEQKIKARTRKIKDQAMAEREQVFRLKDQLEEGDPIDISYEAAAAPQATSIKSLRGSNSFLNRLLDLLEANIDNGAFDLDELSEEIGYSKSQLYRKIKSATGKSPASYLRSVRLHKAMEMIISTDLSISEIAYSVGFNSISHFSRSFSKQFGRSPKEIRLQEGQITN